MPARVPAQAKELIVGLVDDAVRGGGSHRWACSVLGVSDDRAHRWRRRLRDTGTVEDRPPGGVALHALRPAEVAEILALCEQWGPVDRSHRKLAHRGSHEGRVWVSASTLRRVLAAQGLILSEPPARDPAPRVLWPDWLKWEPNKIWCWDVTHFPRAKRAAFAIVDVVSRRWIDTLVSTEETSTQVRVIFDRALAAEGPAELITPERVEQFTKDPTEPILLACSDNGPQMTSTATRDLFAATRQSPNASDAPAPPPTRPGSRASSGTSKPRTPTSKRSATRPRSTPSCDAPAATTTKPACTPASATSPPTTSTPAEANRSAKRVSRAYGEPANSASTTIAATTTTPPRNRHESVQYSANLRGFLRHRSRFGTVNSADSGGSLAFNRGPSHSSPRPQTRRAGIDRRRHPLRRGEARPADAAQVPERVPSQRRVVRTYLEDGLRRREIRDLSKDG